MFEGFGADALVGEIEASLRLESALWARRCAVIAALLARAPVRPRTPTRMRGWR